MAKARKPIDVNGKQLVFDDRSALNLDQVVWIDRSDEDPIVLLISTKFPGRPSRVAVSGQVADRVLAYFGGGTKA